MIKQIQTNPNLFIMCTMENWPKLIKI